MTTPEQQCIEILNQPPTKPGASAQFVETLSQLIDAKIERALKRNEIDDNIAKQLQRSIESNAKLVEKVKSLQLMLASTRAAIKASEGSAHPTDWTHMVEAIDKTLSPED